MFSELTKDRLKRFKKMRRAYYSLWILGIVFLLSLFSEFIANDKPLYLRFQGRSYSPVLFFYSDQTFGGKYKTETDYLTLKEDEQFKKRVYQEFKIYQSYYPSDEVKQLKTIAAKFRIKKEDVKKIIKEWSIKEPINIPELIDFLTKKHFGACIPRDMLEYGIEDFKKRKRAENG